MPNSLYHPHLFAIFFLFATSAHAAIPYREATHSFSLKSGKSLTAIARVYAPKPLESRALPLILIFGGFQNAAQVLDLVDPGQRVLLATFDYPFEPPREWRFPHSLKFAPQAKQMIHEMIEGIGACIEKLKSIYPITSGQVTVIGGSLGAPFAIYSASRFESIQGVVVAHGFGKTRLTIQQQFESLWKSKLGIFASPVSWFLATAAWFYVGLPEVEQAARDLKPKQKVLMIEAKEDRSIPLAARESLRSALKQSQASFKWKQVPGDHFRPGDMDQVREVLVEVTSWMKLEGLVSQ